MHKPKIILPKYEQKCFSCYHYDIGNICRVTYKTKNDNDDCNCDNYIQDLEMVDIDHIDSGDYKVMQELLNE